MRQRVSYRNAIMRRRTIGNAVGHLLVQRNRRSVRITAKNHPEAMTGAPCAATFAFVDLDDAQVDRLIRRLQAVRGGKKTVK